MRRRTLLLAGWIAGAGSARADPALRLEGLVLAGEGGDLVIRRDDGAELRRHAVARLDGGSPSQVAELLANPPRRSVVVAFEALPELWEIPLDPDAPPVFDGYVHDYRMGEAIAKPGYLTPRRAPLGGPVRSLAIDTSGAYVLARTAVAARTVGLRLIHLDVRREIGRWEVEGDPQTRTARVVQRDGRVALQVPDRAGGPGWLVDLKAASLRQGAG